MSSGTITGPTCTPSTTAISLADVAAGEDDSGPIVALALFLLLGVTTAGTVLTRRPLMG